MPKIIDKQEKKSEIFDAAMRTFARKGAAGTKIQDIAEEAGVGKGTIYLYFKNKEEIFQSILHQKVSSGGDLAQEILKAPGEPAKKIKALFSKLAGDIENLDYPPEIQLEILITLMRSPEKHELGKEVIHFRDILSRFLEEVQKKRTARYDSKALASGLLSLLHGIMIHWIIDRNEFPVQEVVEKTLDVLLKDSEEH